MMEKSLLISFAIMAFVVLITNAIAASVDKEDRLHKFHKRDAASAKAFLRSKRSSRWRYEMDEMDEMYESQGPWESTWEFDDSPYEIERDRRENAREAEQRRRFMANWNYGRRHHYNRRPTVNY
ncbi:uncharacterized protein LOC106169425 [Lingula anatina]|uniref:Uncharacterized protein LOC106169425 n=1 Tax=Lingula anatina TaxID=7574 RepID=A0A1S3J246_LINAN|nr:uncharacterized protein LOC106169425 [Lingula anatina]|eukprot:XP_013404336.1 uncharacterized protein LOC106169425 [Lingula anatina]